MKMFYDDDRDAATNPRPATWRKRCRRGKWNETVFEECVAYWVLYFKRMEFLEWQ